MTNPYAPPRDHNAPTLSERPVRRTSPPASSIFIQWEKLRLPYNLVIASPGLIACMNCLQHNYLPPRELAILALITTIGANIFYLAAPLAEIGLSALSQRPPSKQIRAFLIASGFTFSILLILWLGFVGISL